MSTDLLDRPTAPHPVWQPLTHELAAKVRSALASSVGAPEVAVRPLGVCDEHAVAADRGEPESRLTIHVTGHEAVVGPVSSTRTGGCPRCLARRWQALRPRELRDALELGGRPRAAGLPAVTTAFVVDHLAAVSSAAHRRRTEVASVHHVDLDRLTVRRHHLLPDPECPDCAPPPADRSRPLRLRPAPKPAPHEFRTKPLLDQELPLDALANPVCGAVGTVVVTDLSAVTTAATAGGFTTRSGTYLRQTLWGGHADRYGESVRVGLLEGLERYAGIRARAGTRTATAALDDLGDLALDPRPFLYPDAFHDRHPEVDRFSTGRPIRWVEGWSLRDDRPVWVPEVLAHYQTPDQRRRFVQSTSSGCATGGCLEEAVYHGLMEAVERDAFLIAWYAGLSLPELDARTSTRPATRRMVDRLSMYGYDTRLLDTRITFRIPVVTAVAVRRDGGPGAPAVGAGAGLDPEAAVAGALCEIATDAVSLRQRTLKDEARLRAMSEDFFLVAELHDHPLAFGIPEMAVHAGRLLDARTGPRPLPAAYAGAPAPATDLRDDLTWCLEEVTGHGFDVVAVDQTLPEQRRMGLRTVNVLVPGLVPIDFGWDRQRALHLDRVRTAPRAAGLADHDLTDSDLHRVPHPFP
jgi:ribosomal protein S12 methylthiotransferase accessory factor